MVQWWWLPFITALVILLLLVSSSIWNYYLSRSQATNYRKKYSRLVKTIEQVAFAVNRFESSIPALSKELELLNYYESSLSMLEKILETVNEIPPSGTNPKILTVASNLASDCLAKVQVTAKQIENVLRGKNVDLSKLNIRSNPLLALHCYFCSKPFHVNGLIRTRVRMDRVVRAVQSCKSCRKVLLQKKRIKVLYFLKDGKPLHWSNVPEYLPSNEYWNLNERTVNMRNIELKLVQSAESQYPETD